MRKSRFLEIIGLLFFGLVFFTPRAFEFIPVISSFYNKLFPVQCVVLLFAIILSATCSFKNLKNIITLGAVIYLLAGLLLVVYHGGDYKLYIRSGVHLAAVFLIVSYELRNKDNCLIEVTAWFLNILLAVNLVLLILKPEGISSLLTYSEDMAFKQLDRVNFLEVDNRLSLPVLIAIATSFMMPDKKINRVLRVISLVIGGATNLLTMSGTGIGSFFVMLCYVVFIHRSKLRSKLINMKTLLVAYFGCTLLIVYAGMIPPLRNIIQDVLHKDITFSGRTYIWEMCIKMIARHPLAGYGNFDSGWIIKWNGIMRNAHNLFFDILIQGGIILLAGYLVFLLMVFITASDKENKKSQLMLVLLFCLFVVMLCESFLDNNYIFLAYSLALAVKYKHLDNQDTLRLLKEKLRLKAR